MAHVFVVGGAGGLGLAVTQMLVDRGGREPSKGKAKVAPPFREPMASRRREGEMARQDD